MPLTRKKLSRILAAALLALAVVPGYYALTLPWAPQADFDVIGVLFVLQNLPHIVAWFLTAILCVGAIGFWVYGLRERSF